MRVVSYFSEIDLLARRHLSRHGHGLLHRADPAGRVRSPRRRRSSLRSATYAGSTARASSWATSASCRGSARPARWCAVSASPRPGMVGSDGHSSRAPRPTGIRRVLAPAGTTSRGQYRLKCGHRSKGRGTALRSVSRPLGTRQEADGRRHRDRTRARRVHLGDREGGEARVDAAHPGCSHRAGQGWPEATAGKLPSDALWPA